MTTTFEDYTVGDYVTFSCECYNFVEDEYFNIDCEGYIRGMQSYAEIEYVDFDIVITSDIPENLEEFDALYDPSTWIASNDPSLKPKYKFLKYDPTQQPDLDRDI